MRKGDYPDKNGCPFCKSKYIKKSIYSFEYECGSKIHKIGVDQLRTKKCFDIAMRGMGPSGNQEREQLAYKLCDEYQRGDGCDEPEDLKTKS